MSKDKEERSVKKLTNKTVGFILVCIFILGFAGLLASTAIPIEFLKLLCTATCLTLMIGIGGGVIHLYLMSHIDDIKREKDNNSLISKLSEIEKKMDDHLEEYQSSVDIRLDQIQRESHVEREELLVSVKGFIQEAQQALCIDKSVGIRDFVEKMDFAALFDSLKEGDELWWNNTFVPGYPLWTDNMEAAVNRGATIKMMIQSPGSRNADYRKAELKNENFKDELRAFIKQMKSLESKLEDCKGCIQIIEYKELPACPLYLIARNDRPIDGYASWFLSKPTGINFPHFRWQTGSIFLNLMYDYLSSRWNQLETEKEKGELQESE